MRIFSKKLLPTIAQLKDKPVLFKGAAKHWSALEKWTPAYLDNTFQGSAATNLFSFGREYQRKKLTGFTTKKAFSEVLHGDASQRFYLTRQPLLQNEIKLLKDIEIPDWVTNKKFHMSNIWIGQKTSLTPLHYDSTDGYLCQIHGYKRIYLWSPSDSLYLCPTSPLTGGQFNLSQVAHFHDLSVVQKYTHFLQSTVLSYLLSPGDTLYIPQGWWHQVYNLGYSIAVNFFFTQEVNGYSPKQEILMYQACKTLEKTSVSEVINRGNYNLCFENARALLKINCLNYASYFALSYFEEYVKAHLAKWFFSGAVAKLGNDVFDKVRVLVTDLFNSRQSNSEKYYANLWQANEYLKIGNDKAHIPEHLMKKWINFSKSVLRGEASNNHQLKDVELLIAEIEKTCVYEIHKDENMSLAASLVPNK